MLLRGNGVVTIEGAVENDIERDLACEIARQAMASNERCGFGAWVMMQR